MKSIIKQTLQIKSLRDAFNEPNKENSCNFNNHINKSSISKRIKETKTKIENQDLNKEKKAKNIFNNYNYDIRPKSINIITHKNKAMFHNFLIVIIFYVILLKIEAKSVLNKLILKSNTITLTINNDGNQKIFFVGSGGLCESIDYFPNTIKVKGNTLESNEEVYTTGVYNFQERNNNVELIWDNPLTSLSCLFYNCTQIETIDLSNYDSTDVTLMRAMFLDCSSLTSIKFN